MASKALRGLTIEIGGDTTELNKALDSVDKRTKNLSSELGEINRALKLDPTNTELLAQKQKVLADSISNTEKKLDTLKEAEKQVQAQFERGEVSQEQVRALRREIIETERKLDGYKNAVEETTAAEKKLADGADDAADALDEQADKTEDAENASDDLDNSVGDLAKGGLKALAAAAAAATASIIALAEESREYRNEMAKLDTAFQNVGLSSEAATKTYEELQSILGETDQAVEASSLLARLCTSEEELADWTEILTGVYGTFGNSLPVEGLAEAANETKKVGQVTGPLADALNWAAEEGETFGVVMKENTEANAEWNKAVEEAASAEDYFNLALQECSTEQERQQLTTKTLTKLYGNASKQFKETNKQVINANKANEEWRKTTAKVGEAVEPVVTDIKKLGASLLKDAQPALERAANFIREKVLPAIKKLSDWVKRNWPIIKAAIIGATVALIAYQAAVIATTVVQQGLTTALKATKVAQAALNAVQKVNPWMLLASAVAGLIAGLIAYTSATKKAKDITEDMTQEEKELAEAAAKAGKELREQHEATKETMRGIESEAAYTKKLADELIGLADATGKVNEQDEARVRFILDELNEKLGTEYELVDGLIQGYDDLSANVEEYINKRKAQLLLESYEGDYVEAIKALSDATQAEAMYFEDYQNALAATTPMLKTMRENLAAAYDDYYYYLENGMSDSANAIYQTEIATLEDSVARYEQNLAQKKWLWEQAAEDKALQTNIINNYEDAQVAALEGNFVEAAEILNKKTEYYGNYSSAVDHETAKVLDALYLEAIEAGENAKLMKYYFENGVEGYTEEMVKEAEEGYNAAMEEFANAYADAEGHGKNLTDGLTDGAESGRAGLLAKARSLISSFFNTVEDEADMHSPSKRAIKTFKNIGAGAEIGIDDKTKDVEKAATRQVGAVFDAYNAQEVNAQRALRGLAEQQAANYSMSQMAAAASNSPLLEKILAAIEKGQVIALDGDAIVGATAARMDSALGSRRVLASRGAI